GIRDLTVTGVQTCALPIYFTTAREPAHARLAAELAEVGAEIVHVSGSLADRTALRRELEGVDAEVFLTEIKAAAIDVVAEAGARSEERRVGKAGGWVCAAT